MADSIEDTQFFARIDATAKDVLSLNCDHIGFVPSDAEVSRSLKRAGVLPWAKLDARTAAAIERIAGRIEHYWYDSIEGSADLLSEYVMRELAPPHDPASE
jgi:MinD-like ATPase involved in chromosome partitioning or flagellar assembly